MKVSGQLNALAAPPLGGKGPPWMLGGPQSRSEGCEEKNLVLCRDSNTGRPALSLPLYRLSYPGSYENEVMRYLVFLSSCGGVRLNPLGTSATSWPVVPTPDDTWVWSTWWNDNWQETPKYSEETCPSTTLSTTNPTWLDLGSNPGRHSRKPATNRLSCGTAISTDVNMYLREIKQT
jgi:hypothetical protein